MTSFGSHHDIYDWIHECDVFSWLRPIVRHGISMISSQWYYVWLNFKPVHKIKLSIWTYRFFRPCTHINTQIFQDIYRFRRTKFFFTSDVTYIRLCECPLYFHAHFPDATVYNTKLSCEGGGITFWPTLVVTISWRESEVGNDMILVSDYTYTGSVKRNSPLRERGITQKILDLYKKKKKKMIGKPQVLGLQLLCLDENKFMPCFNAQTN